MAFLITKPFLTVLISGAIIAYLAHPIYVKLLKYLTNKHVASFVLTVAILLLITMPFVITLGLVSKEAISTYSTLEQHNLGTNFAKIVCGQQEWVSCKTLRLFARFLPDRNLDYYMQVTIEKISGFIIDNISRFLLSIPSMLLNLFVMSFIIYYLLIDGEDVANRIKRILPLKESHKSNVFARFHDCTYTVFYSNIAVALVQGILGGIGFFAFGVSSPVLWGSVMAVFSLIPYFGSAIIWLPAALNLIFEGYLQNSNSLIVKGVMLIIYGALIISLADNFLKPKLISAKANIHPILVLLGVLGGLNLFGFMGLVIGPIMLALLMTFVEIYEKEKVELEKYF